MLERGIGKQVVEAKDYPRITCEKMPFRVEWELIRGVDPEESLWACVINGPVWSESIIDGSQRYLKKYHAQFGKIEASPSG